jgi:hypothetical protein
MTRLILTLVILTTSLNTFAQSSVVRKGKWKFRFQSSFGTNDYQFDKNFMSVNSAERELRQHIKDAATNYTDHGDRLQFLSQKCKGLSEENVIRMGRYLSDQLSDIYDYERIGKGPNVDDVVGSADQWTALRNRYTQNGGDTTKGVCRDMADTVSEMLRTCGIPKERIGINAYRTATGGHQVVDILGENGKTYVINWSELYETENDQFNTAINPNLMNTGIVTTRYDSETGKVIDERYTELGHILASVTGGRVHDEDYIPNLIQMEANYSVLTAGAYMAETQRGDMLKGVKLAYDQRPLKWLHLGAGVTYAHNTLAYEQYDNFDREIDQHILFFQFFGEIDIPELQLLKRENSGLYWKNNVEVSGAMANYWTSIDGNKQGSNFDSTFGGKVQTGLIFRSNKVDIEAGAGIDFGINDKRFNHEMDGYLNGGQYPSPFLRGKFVNARATLKGDRFDWTLSGKAYFYSYGGIQKLNLRLQDKKKFGIYDVGVLNYNDVLGFNDTYVTAGVRKQWDIKDVGWLSLGAQVQVPMRPDPLNGVNGMLTLSFTPSFGKDRRKKKKKRRRSTYY